MPVEFENPHRCQEFIRLNELWITEHFALEESERKLAADPYRIVREGGHILSLVENGKVAGVSAQFKESPTVFQRARMAVDPNQRGKGNGTTLFQAAIAKARDSGTANLCLLTNTVLAPAVALYRKHGFETVSEGAHPVYARCNLVMERRL
jgi:GNAT superfamily N-acetyltransferase